MRLRGILLRWTYDFKNWVEVPLLFQVTKTESHGQEMDSDPLQGLLFSHSMRLSC